MGIRAPRVLRGRGNAQRWVNGSEAVLSVGHRRGSRVRRPRAARICRALSSGNYRRVHRDPPPLHHRVPRRRVVHATGERMGLRPRVCGGYRPDIALLSESRHERVEPGDSGFWFVMSVLPALFLILVFSILSFMNAKPGLMQKRYLATPQSTGGLLTVAVIGFVIGSLVAGAIGAGVILGNTTGVAANIQIVPNAPAVAMAFSPQSFQIPVGGTVTWINKDTMAHMVTSNTTGLFGSSLLTPGASCSHVFAQNGTFYYHCDPHRQMWGVIVVVVS